MRGRLYFLIGGGFVIFLSLLALMTSVGIDALDEGRKELDVITSDSLVELNLLYHLRFLIRNEAVFVRNILIYPEKGGEELSKIKKNRAEYNETWSRFLKLHGTKDTALIDAIIQGEKNTRLLWDSVINGQLKESNKVLFESVRQSQWTWLDDLLRLIEIEHINVRQGYENGMRSYRHSRNRLMVIGLVTLLWGVMASVAIMLNMAKPLQAEIKAKTLDIEKTNADLMYALDELREAKQFVDTVTHGISDEIFLISPDYRILWANDAVSKKYSSAPFIGELCYRIIHKSNIPCDMNDESCPIISSMKTGKLATAIHVHPNLHDNMTKFVEISVYPIYNEVSEIDKFVYILKDVSERVQLEERLRAKTEMLEELNAELDQRVRDEIARHRQKEQMLIQQSKMAAMGELISMISHQWKQPLNAIGITMQDLMDANNFGEMNSEYLNDSSDTIMQQVRFMSKTIDDFRDFLRPSREKSMFNLKEAVDEILTMFVPYFSKSDITIRVLSDSGEFKVFGYHSEFQQVILNLINNARDAILERRESGATDIIDYIDIAIRCDRDLKFLSVRDTGGGISDDVFDNIFEQYFTTKGLDKGTGIGLYMSKIIIENNMGWKLTVHNVDGGAEFVIEI